MANYRVRGCDGGCRIGLCINGGEKVKIKLGEFAKLYWKAINSKYDDPAFNFYEMSRVLYVLKDLLENESIDAYFAKTTFDAFCDKVNEI